MILTTHYHDHLCSVTILNKPWETLMYHPPSPCNWFRTPCTWIWFHTRFLPYRSRWQRNWMKNSTKGTAGLRVALMRATNMNVGASQKRAVCQLSPNHMAIQSLRLTIFTWQASIVSRLEHYIHKSHSHQIRRGGKFGEDSYLYFEKPRGYLVLKLHLARIKRIKIAIAKTKFF